MRTFNIIQRAINDGFKLDVQDRLIDILCEAEDYIKAQIDYDYIAECDTNRHYTHINWSDDKGFEYESDGQFIDQHNPEKNTFYRYKDGAWVEVASWAVQAGDYVVMDSVFDSEGNLACLVAKW